jgi:hypothetical protein
VLRRRFGPQRKKEVAGDWRTLFHHLYDSTNIIRVIKSRGMRLVGHVASMEQMRIHIKFRSGNLK